MEGKQPDHDDDMEVDYDSDLEAALALSLMEYDQNDQSAAMHGGTMQQNAMPPTLEPSSSTPAPPPSAPSAPISQLPPQPASTNQAMQINPLAAALQQALASAMQGMMQGEISLIRCLAIYR